MRIIIEIFFFLMPFIIYAIVLKLMKRDPKDRVHWQGKRFLLLCVLGLFIAFLGLVFIGDDSRTMKAGETYVPARVENGVFKPAEHHK